MYIQQIKICIQTEKYRIKVKTHLSLNLIKHHEINTYRRVEVWLPAFVR
jgi:hypothetical protein